MPRSEEDSRAGNVPGAEPQITSHANHANHADRSRDLKGSCAMPTSEPQTVLPGGDLHRVVRAHAKAELAGDTFFPVKAHQHGGAIDVQGVGRAGS